MIRVLRHGGTRVNRPARGCIGKGVSAAAAHRGWASLVLRS